MFLVAWWLTGVFLGWFIWTFYLVWRYEGAADANPVASPDPFAELVLKLLNFLAKRYGLKVQRDDDEPAIDLGQPTVEAPSRMFAIAAFVALVVVALSVLVFAAATDHAQLHPLMLVVKSYLVGVRVQALVVGILSGFAFKQYQAQLRDFTRRLADAIIGSKDNTAWALQSALAIGLIAIGLFAVRPDFLLYLRSFKLGTVEATFGDQGPLPLRDARLNLRDFRSKLSVQVLAHFDQFWSPNSVRGRARQLLEASSELPAIHGEAININKLFFGQYLNPVLSSVVCLEDMHALRAAIHDPNLSAYVSAWEDFLLEVHSGKPRLTEDRLKSFLAELRLRSDPFVRRVSALNPDCGITHTLILYESFPSESRLLTDQEASQRIYSYFRRATDALKATDAKASLVVMEPYLTAAVAELILLISGEREKADFLINMLDGFQPSNDLISPGIINLYFQATDSWLNSTGSLPLGLVSEQIEYATRGAQLVMTRSEERLRAPGPASPGYADRDSENEMMTMIYDAFLRNSFATLDAEVNIYVQRVLDGERVSPRYRQNWINAASRLSAMLQARSNMPRIEFNGLPRTELNSFENERLRVAKKIDPEFIMQANISIALSAILLSDGDRISAQACTAALFYVNEASIGLLQTIAEYSPDKSQETRLHQLIGAVANRVGDSCSWADGRGEAIASETKAK